MIAYLDPSIFPPLWVTSEYVFIIYTAIVNPPKYLIFSQFFLEESNTPEEIKTKERDHFTIDKQGPGS